MRQKPVVTHARLVVMESLWMLVVQLVMSIVAIEVDVHWVFPQLGAPNSPSLL